MSIQASASCTSPSSIRAPCGRRAWRPVLINSVLTNSASTGDVMVRVEGLRKSYGTVEAVRGVSLEVHRGQVVVLIGPSGCGKSTFLRCLNLLEAPSAGTLQVGGRAIDFRSGHSMQHGRALARFRARIGMVVQQFDLFPHMTALRNVMAGPAGVKERVPAQGGAIPPAPLSQGWLAAFPRRYPRALSGAPHPPAALTPAPARSSR